MPVIRHEKGRWLGSRKRFGRVAGDEIAARDVRGKKFSQLNPYRRYGISSAGKYAALRRNSIPALIASGVILASSKDAPKGKIRRKEIKDKAMWTAGGAAAGHTAGKVGSGVYAGAKEAWLNRWATEDSVNKIFNLSRKQVTRNARLGALLGAGIPLSLYAAGAVARARDRKKRQKGKS